MQLLSDDQELLASIQKKHRQHFGNLPKVVAYAPGRVEVLGNHTDYNEGKVLSAAIDLGTCFAISKNTKLGLRLYAANLNKSTTIDISHPKPISAPSWGNYIKGIMFFLQKHIDNNLFIVHSQSKDSSKFRIENWDCTFWGTVPIGSGLSSSAALEVSAAYASLELLGIQIAFQTDEQINSSLSPHYEASIPQLTVAKICQSAENQFVGAKTGLLDQLSSIHGISQELIQSDFRTNTVQTVALPPKVQFLLLNPEIQHDLSSSPYNDRRKSCEEALKELSVYTSLSALRDITMKRFQDLKDKIHPVQARRAEHVIGEHERVEKGVQALKSGDLASFGKLMYESHESSRTLFENSLPVLDTIVKIAQEQKALGARLTGGGWGGSVIVLSTEENVQALEANIPKLCLANGIHIQTQRIKPSAGARVLMSSSQNPSSN